MVIQEACCRHNSELHELNDKNFNLKNKACCRHNSELHELKKHCFKMVAIGLLQA